MLRRTMICLVFVVLSWVVAEAADAPKELAVNGERIKSYIAYLSTDALEGRMTSTPGYRKAADWVAGKFKEWGVKPAGENGTYFQTVTGIRDLEWNTGAPTLGIGDRKFVLDDGDFQLDTMSTPGFTCQAEIVFVGYGISAPNKGLDEYDGIDVKGKVVLVFKGSPKDAPAEQQRFGGGEEPKQEKAVEAWKDESTTLSKIKTAYEKGAAAILLFDPAESTESDSGRRSSRTARTDFTTEREFLCFTVKERVFRAIMKRDPQESPRGLERRIGGICRSIQEKKAQSFATGVQANLKGYDTSVQYNEKNGNNTGRNVLAKIEGTDPQRKNEYVIVGAHLDHVGMRDGYVYNGADDNASGSAVVMEIARVLTEANFKPRRTLIFCCWTGEERGLLGSYFYTKQPCDGVTMDKVVTYFNLDMVGMGATLGAPGALNFPTIWEVIQRDQDPDDMKRVEPSTGGPGGSDHSGFITKGIEALALMSRGGVGHNDYHQPEDDIEKIEPEMLRLSGQFVLQGMINLANDTETQLLIEGRLEQYKAVRMRISNFNPEVENSRWTVVDIKEKSPEAMRTALISKIRDLLKTTAPSASSSRYARYSRTSSTQPSASGQDSARGRKSLSRGIAGVSCIGSDSELLSLVVDYYGIGRADVKADDPALVADGRLTEAGKATLKVLEQHDVVVRLISPSEGLIEDMANAASKPFIITGSYTIPEQAVDRLVSRGVLLGIDLDPQKIDDFINRVEEVKKQIGERKNLFAFLTSEKGLDEAKKPLYFKLLEKGWGHAEIMGGRDHQGLIGGAGLDSLGK